MNNKMKRPIGNLEIAYNKGFIDGALNRDEEWIKKQTEQKEELLKLAEFYSVKIPAEIGISKFIPLYEMKYIINSIFETEEKHKEKTNEY